MIPAGNYPTPRIWYDCVRRPRELFSRLEDHYFIWMSGSLLHLDHNFIWITTSSGSQLHLETETTSSRLEPNTKHNHFFMKRTVSAEPSMSIYIVVWYWRIRQSFITSAVIGDAYHIKSINAQFLLYFRLLQIFSYAVSYTHLTLPTIYSV